MNASFRTAFWAMCLGLTVPMMLFVGVELTSGGRASSGRKGSAATTASSLQTQWVASGPSTAGSGRKADKSTRSVRRPVGPRTQASQGTSPQSFNGARLSPDLEPDIDPDLPMNGAEPAPWNDVAGDATSLAGSVTLDPQLEPDSDLDDVPHGHLRHPAHTASTRPRSHSASGQHAPGAPFPVSRIESQLDEIIGYLERISASSSARAPATTADPMQQAADLLIRLQQARRIQDLTGQILDQPDPSRNVSGKPAPQEKASDKKLTPAPQGADAPILQPTPAPNASDSARGPVIVPQSSSQPGKTPADLKPAVDTKVQPTTSAPAQPPLVRPGSTTKTRNRSGSVTTADLESKNSPRSIRQAVATRSPNERPRERVTRKLLPERSARLKGSNVVDGCDHSESSAVRSPLAVAAAPQAGVAVQPPVTDAQSVDAGVKSPGESPYSGRRIPSNPE